MILLHHLLHSYHHLTPFHLHLLKQLILYVYHAIAASSNITQPKGVVLLAYYRGGSSFLGELMNQNPDVFYVFEPLRGVNKWLYGNWGVNIPTMYNDNHPFR